MSGAVLALAWVRAFFLIAVALQTLEHLIIEWKGLSWALASGANHRFLGLPRKALNLLSLMIGLILVFLIGIGIDPPWIYLVFILLHFLYLLNFFGSFNGGSDALTFMVSFGLFYASLVGSESVATEAVAARAALTWIAIQSALSYFLSGLRKVRHQEWWTGEALASFLKNSPLSIQSVRSFLMESPKLVWVASILTLVFELGFPVCFFSRSLGILFLGSGILFHFGIFVFFGLNRFFWIWISTYPALWFLIQ